MVSFTVLKTQFQKFIKSRFSLYDEDGLMTRKYFLAYTQTEVQQFHDALIQYMKFVKKLINKRALNKREYDNRVKMQTIEGKDTSSRSGNDADIKPVYDEEPMVEVQLTAELLKTQFQKFIKSWFSLYDEDGLMTRKYFLAYTQTEVQQFHDALIQYMKFVKKLINKRALNKREYDNRVKMQTTEGTDTSSHSGNDADADDADIKPVYDKEPMVEVQLTGEYNVLDIEQQHTEQPEFINEGGIDQNTKQCHDKHPLLAKLTDNKKTKLSHQSLEFENICLKKTVSQFQKDFSKLEAHCINLELQLQNNVLKSGQHGQFLKEKSNEAKV
nr:hypothetical protein [Tanacetum cinerariifolium]